MRKFYFKETEEIKRRLIEIEANKMVFEGMKIVPQVEENIRRISILKSSVYSARIEGNPLTLENAESETSDKEKKREIFNLLTAYNRVYGENQAKLTVSIIKDIHETVMRGINSRAGKFRQEAWAIFNSAGFAIYLAPPYFEIPKLMEQYLEFVNNLKCHQCIKAGVAQFIFEKIHPFADGNGRAGRLVSACILRENNYHFRGMLPFEEYTDNHRQEYYYALEPSTDMTQFVEYFLDSLVIAGKEVIEATKQNSYSKKDELNLMPRRQEIVNIVADHPLCSFEFLSRRFDKVNPKTLHYDLKKLLDLGVIVKVGSTRGSLYKCRN